MSLNQLVLGPIQQNKVCLLRYPRLESLPAGFSGFPGHRRAPIQHLLSEREDGLQAGGCPLAGGVIRSVSNDYL